MSVTKSTRAFVEGCLSVLLLVGSALATPKHCTPAGGAFLTNVGGFGDNTTLGVISGDIRGAVGVQIVNITTAPDGTTTISVQHHLVTETGNTVYIDPAQAFAVPVAPGLFAITKCQIHTSGEPGRFKGASGDMSAIGEADFNTGHLIGRYTGTAVHEFFGAP